MNTLNTVVSFDENNKWLSVAEGNIEGKKYSYLVKLNSTFDDITDEYKLYKSEYSLGDEYMEEVTDKNEIRNVIPILVPEVREFMDNPEKVQSLL